MATPYAPEDRSYPAQISLTPPGPVFDDHGHTQYPPRINLTPVQIGICRAWASIFIAFDHCDYVRNRLAAGFDDLHLFFHLFLVAEGSEGTLFPPSTLPRGILRR